MKVLILGPDEPVLLMVENTLIDRGHQVRRTDRGDEAVSLASTWEFIVVDLDLPHTDGYNVCARIRRFSAVPIVMLTPSAEEIDRVVGLRMGADDCVARPFSVRELVTRIDAVARRARPGAGEAAASARTLRVGALAIDVPGRRVAWHNAELRLTRKEFDLLAMLAENAGTVCVRERIFAQVWNENWFGSSRTVDVHIGSLRRKLGSDCPIETVRGVGFRLSN